MKFKHFIDENENTINHVTCYVGSFGMGFEHIEDVSVDLGINEEGEINIKVSDTETYLTQNEVNQINNELLNINWDGGYEFVSFFDLNSGIEYYLEGYENSETFNLINSPANIQNINNFPK